MQNLCSLISDSPQIPCNRENISILALNARSIRNEKFDSLISTLDLLKKEWSLIIITESWLNNQETARYNLNGYNKESYCRKRKKGGGILMFIHKNLSYSTTRNKFTEANSESLSIRLTNGKKYLNTIITAIYRPPTSGSTDKFLEELDEELEYRNSNRDKVIIIGDINIDYIKDSPDSREYTQVLNSNFFAQLITEPTRKTLNTKSCIDHIITNVNFFTHAAGTLATDLSDHDMVFLLDLGDHKKERQELNNKSKFNYKLYSKETLVSELEKQNLNEILDTNDVNIAYTNLITKISKAIDYFYTTPTNKKINKISVPRHPWISHSILKYIKLKADKYELTKKYPQDESLLNSYKKFANLVKNEIRKSKKEYFAAELEKVGNDPKAYWKVVKNALGIQSEKQEHPTQININNSTLSSKQEISNAFNEYFSKVGKDLADAIDSISAKQTDEDPLINMPPPQRDSFFCTPISTAEIQTEIKNLDINKGPGWDRIGPRIVKDASDILAPILEYIFNKSILSGTFPEDMKTAIVTPIFKGGAAENISNYRPISILPLFSKIFERLIYARMSSFVEKHCILNPRQFGFRSGISTIDALSLIASKIQSALNEGERSILLCIDIRKAFDSVKHLILTRKLAHYGFRGNFNDWITSYLSNRKQITRIGEVKSEDREVTYGVPQGSILGPLFFILFINDLPNIVEYGEIALFADDSGIVYSGSDLTCIFYHAQLDVNAIENWSRRNYLTLNLDKTHYLMISTPNSKKAVLPDLRISNTIIQPVESTRFLGVIFDQHLRWDIHIEQITKQISTYVGSLSVIRHYIPFKTLKLIFDAFINSRLAYGIEIWGDTYQAHLKSLQVVQNRAIRFMTFTGFREHITPAYKTTGIKNLSSLYNLKMSLYAHKAVKQNKFKFKNCITPRNLLNLQLPTIKNNYGLHSILSNIVKKYNSLPASLKCSAHNSHTRQQIKKFMCTQ